MNTIPQTGFRRAPDPQNTQPAEPAQESKNRTVIIVVAYFATVFISMAIGIYFSYRFIQDIRENGITWEFSETDTDDGQMQSDEEASQYQAFYESAEEIRLLWGRGEYEEMLEQTEDLMALAADDSQMAVAYYWNGLAYYNLSDYKKAETSLSTSVDLDDTYAAPHVTLSAINLNSGEYNEAFEHAEICVELDPDYAWCHNALGLAYLALGNNPDGVNALEKAVELDPENYSFQSNLMRARGE